MKRISFILLGLALTTGVVFTSCKKDTVLNPGSDVANVVLTPGSSSSFNLTDIPGAYVEFTLGVVGEGATEVKIYKQFVNASTTSAEVLHATITTFPSTLNITLADALNGLGVAPADFAVGDQVLLTFKLMVNGKEYISRQTIEANGACPTDLGGTYQVVTTYSQHDFLPNFATFTDTVDIVDEGDGLYSVADLSGGLYSQGPYVGAYGTSGIEATFQDVCNTISWSDVADPWGQVVPTPGGVNAVDGATGVITISWKCLAYNESGVSVYTKL